MQTIYSAQNELDAQLVVDRLAAHDIPAHIVGRFLSSAAGELPAQSLVRVQVADQDAERAVEVITEWKREIALPDSEAPPATQSAEHSAATAGGGGFGAAASLILGLVIGAVGTWALLRLPPSTNEIDYNGDGIIDERYVYRGERLHEVQYDRNGDGDTDFRVLPSSRTEGDATQLVDDDFDGRYENRDDVIRGNVSMSEYDRDGDGFAEVRASYHHGVLEEVVYRTPKDDRVIKREFYRHGVLERSEADLDGDGQFETRWAYDKLQEPSRSP